MSHSPEPYAVTIVRCILLAVCFIIVRILSEHAFQSIISCYNLLCNNVLLRFVQLRGRSECALYLFSSNYFPSFFVSVMATISEPAYSNYSSTSIYFPFKFRTILVPSFHDSFSFLFCFLLLSSIIISHC